MTGIRDKIIYKELGIRIRGFNHIAKVLAQLETKIIKRTNKKGIGID